MIFYGFTEPKYMFNLSIFAKPCGHEMKYKIDTIDAVSYLDFNSDCEGCVKTAEFFNEIVYDIRRLFQDRMLDD